MKRIRSGAGKRQQARIGAPDIQEREHGEAIPLLARLGPAGLETLDTLIMGGIAATRGGHPVGRGPHPRAVGVPAAA